jgi:hypothetical protein
MSLTLFLLIGFAPLPDWSFAARADIGWDVAQAEDSYAKRAIWEPDKEIIAEVDDPRLEDDPPVSALKTSPIPDPPQSDPTLISPVAQDVIQVWHRPSWLRC